MIQVSCTDGSHEGRKHIVGTFAFHEEGFGPLTQPTRSKKRMPQSAVTYLEGEVPLPEGETPFNTEHMPKNLRPKIDLECRLCGLRLQTTSSVLEDKLAKAAENGIKVVELRMLIAIIT